MRRGVIVLLSIVSLLHAQGAAATVTVDLVAGPEPDLLIVQGDPVTPGTLEYFTYALAVGDFDGDGVSDLAVAGASPAPGFVSGAVYVFYGASFTPPITIDLADPAESADLTIVATGPAAEGFGTALASGNIDGDADDELFIGAFAATTADGMGGFPPAGVVDVLLGPLATSGIRDVTTVSGEPDLQFQGVGSPTDSLGAALATGDVDGDGFDELAIGAPLSSGGEGSVYLIDFQAGFGPFVTLPPAGPTPGIESFETAEPGAELGRALAMGDVDADGLEDVIIGAPFFDGGKGKVYVVNPVGGITEFVAPDVETHLGFSVASGDVDGDGASDIVIGAPGADASAPTRVDAGAVFVVLGPGASGTLPGPAADITIYGAKGDPDATSNSPAPGTDLDDPGGLLGTSVATGDIDGDGADDLVVGAPFEDGSTALYGGHAYSFTTLTASPPFVIDLALTPDAPTTKVIGTGGSVAVADPELFGDFMGRAVACGDFNGDGLADLIAGGVSDPAVMDTGKLALQLGVAPPPPADSLPAAGVVLLFGLLLTMGLVMVRSPLSERQR